MTPLWGDLDEDLGTMKKGQVSEFFVVKIDNTNVGKKKQIQLEIPLCLKMVKKFGETMHPNKKAIFPEDVAKYILFLASDDASKITGVDLFVDGGWHMAGPQQEKKQQFFEDLRDGNI